MKQEINQTDLEKGKVKVPKFYGKSYYVIGKDTAIYYPIPLNRMISFFRRLYFHFKCGPIWDPKSRQQAYEQGYWVAMKRFAPNDYKTLWQEE